MDVGAARRLRWFCLLALFGVAVVVFSRSPSTRTVRIELGDRPAHLRALELLCEDDEELNSGGRWTFDAATAPAVITHSMLTTGTQLKCEITLRSEQRSTQRVREAQLMSEEIRLYLGDAVDALR